MSEKFSWVQVAGLAFLLAGLSYFLQAGVRLNWADEGVLWYGTGAVLKGQVPILDFLPYDPGRFYWCALFSRLLGGGLLALRLGEFLFQGFALTFGLLALRRAYTAWRALTVAAILSMLWQFWAFRFFDAGLPLIAVFFAVRLLEKPSSRRHFAAGTFVGVSAFFGLNHALYIFAAFYSLTIFFDWKKMTEGAAKKRFFFFAGAAAGVLPIVGMMLAVPGFWESYWERFAHHGIQLSRGATDFSRAIVWPWNLRWSEVTKEAPNFWIKLLHFSNLWAQGAAFLTLILFYLFSVPRLLKLNKETLVRQPLFAASVFVGVFYFHHVLTRRDITHLGEGIFPMIAGVCAISGGAIWTNRKRLRRLLALWIFALSIAAALPLGNLFFQAFVSKEKMELYRFGKDAVWISKTDARLVDQAKKIVKEHVPPDQTLLIAPLLTTLYCVLDKESPVREIYFYMPRPDNFQKETIRQLEERKVNWAILGNPLVEGRPERQFSNTHPILWEYLMTHFDAVSDEEVWPGHYLLKKKS